MTGTAGGNVAEARLQLPPQANTVLTATLSTLPSKRHHVSCTFRAIFKCLGLRRPQLTLFVSPQSGQDAFNTTSSI